MLRGLREESRWKGGGGGIGEEGEEADELQAMRQQFSALFTHALMATSSSSSFSSSSLESNERENEKSHGDGSGECDVDRQHGDGDESMQIDDIVAPFLMVIRSAKTSGVLTSSSLHALCVLIDSSQCANDALLARCRWRPSAVARAIQQSSKALVQCQFEATDMRQDELVLRNIANALVVCMQCDAAARHLDAGRLFAMFETAFRLCTQERLSALLRVDTESSLRDMIDIIFARSPATDGASSSASSSAASASSCAPPPSSVSARTDAPLRCRVLEYLCGAVGSDVAPRVLAVQLRALARIVHVHWRTFLDSAALLSVVQARLCRFAMQLALAPAWHGVALSSALALLSSLFSIGELQPHLLAQCQAYVAMLVDEMRACDALLASANNNGAASNADASVSLSMQSGGAPSQTLSSLSSAAATASQASSSSSSSSQLSTQAYKSVLLDALVDLANNTELMFALYVNLDCDIGSSDALGNACKALYKNALPESKPPHADQLRALDGLVSIVAGIERLDGEAHRRQRQRQRQRGRDAVLLLRERKQAKQRLQVAVEHFNRKPAEGVRYLQSAQLLCAADAPGYAASIARFVRTMSLIDKAKLGEFIGKKANAPLLDAFCDSFRFGALSFVDAVRHFLRSFRLPGESPVIERIMEAFAARYFASSQQQQQSCPFANADAVFVFSYSVIMLNVDLHNVLVKNKMTLEQFVRNVRGINDGGNLPRDMLVDVYASIEKSEIKLDTSVTDPRVANDAANWRNLVQRGRRVQCARNFIDPLALANDESDGDDGDSNRGAPSRDIFSLVWGPVIAAASVLFDSVGDRSPLVQRAIDMFYLCARVAARHRLCNVLDNLVITLCKFSSLLTLGAERTASLCALADNRKAQRALVAVFSVVRARADHLREGWRTVLRCIMNLRSLGVLDDQQQRSPSSSRKDANDEKENVASSSSYSLLGGLLEAAGLWGSDVAEPASNQALQRAEDIVRECVADCRISELVASTNTLQPDSLVYLVRALILATGGGDVDGELACFCVRMLADIVLLNVGDRLRFVWLLVYEHLGGIVGGETARPALALAALDSLLRIGAALLDSAPDNEPQLVRALELVARLGASLPTGSALASECGARVAHAFAAIEPAAIDGERASPALYAAVVRLGEFAARHGDGDASEVAALDALDAHVRATASGDGDRWPHRFNALVRALLAFGAGNDRQRAYELVLALYAGAANALADTSQRYALCWQPALVSIVGAAAAPTSSGRQFALRALQQALLAVPLDALDASLAVDCFATVLFPLLGGVDAADEESCVRAANILVKSFLQLLPTLSASIEQFTCVWNSLLRAIADLYASEHGGDVLREALQEMLKNLLLVLSTTAVLSDHRHLRADTHRILASFCASLVHEPMIQSILNIEQEAEAEEKEDAS
jgi:golgi-specific brefeldin A-resistance guanine nucleotide exchange factor 1